MTRKRLFTLLALGLVNALPLFAQDTPVCQMENLGRGVVALPRSSGSGRFVSWRFLGTDDPERTTFTLLRNGKVVKSGLTVTNYEDASGTATSEYQVVTVVDGEPADTSKAVQAWDKVWLKLSLDRPATGAQGGTYTPNDCSVGDVDGDGEYELFVKWDPSTSKDNSQGGITDNVYIDCYKLTSAEMADDKTTNRKYLWRIDLGRNIRAGAHYTQYMVYDFDGDGKAELMCKTAPGTKDGMGNYVNQTATDEQIKAASNTKSWVTSEGRINGGQEYLTVFDGLTGSALHTIAYNPNRNATSELSEAEGTFNWGADSKNDRGSYGNRGERYLAAVAYIDGVDGHASGIFCRGYYTYAYVWAVSFDGTRLIPRWLHRSDATNKYSVVTYDDGGNGTTKNYTPAAATSKGGSRTMYGNGNHNLSVADVDGDGSDEIIWGSATLNADGTLRYATGFGHGDAIHIGKMIPGRQGLQVFQVHEEKGTYAWDLHDADTGEILQKGGPEGVDNGRGMAAQLTSKSQEWWFSSASDRQQRSAVTGEVASTANGALNFRIYWDGTPQDELLDGSALNKYDDSKSKFNRLVTFSNLGPGSTCNSTKNTPNLSGDILGDWREEVILYTVTDEEAYLGIYSTNIVTKYTVPTLMHDHTYRMAICWQNVAYNQPPHLGYNLAEAVAPRFLNEQMDTTVQIGKEMSITLRTRNASSITLTKSILPDGSYKVYNVPDGFTKTLAKPNLTIAGTPDQMGDYQFVVQLMGVGGEKLVDTLTVHVTSTTGIESDIDVASKVMAIYDLSGHQVPDSDIDRLPHGVYLVQRRTAQGIVTSKIMK